MPQEMLWLFKPLSGTTSLAYAVGTGPSVIETRSNTPEELAVTIMRRYIPRYNPDKKDETIRGRPRYSGNLRLYEYTRAVRDEVHFFAEDRIPTELKNRFLAAFPKALEVRIVSKNATKPPK